MSEQTEYVDSCLDRLVPELVGLKVTGGAVDESGEYWGLVLEGKKGKKKVKKVAFVLADPEGNGAGFLEINEG